MTDKTLPEPGEVADPRHGIPGPAEKLPRAEVDEPTTVNDDDDEEEDDE